MSYTYDTLKAAIQKWYEDPDEDFEAVVDDFISGGQAMCYRQMNLQIWEQTMPAIPTSSGVGTLQLGDKNTTSLLEGTVNGSDMYLRSKSFVKVMQQAPQDTPLYFAMDSETTAILAPIPALAQNVVFVRRLIPPLLVSGQPATWLSTNFPALLFYACMAEAGTYVRSPDDTTTWDGRFNGALAATIANTATIASRDVRPVAEVARPLPVPVARASG